MNKKQFSIKEAVLFGWEKVKANFWRLAFILASVIALDLLVEVFKPAEADFWSMLGKLDKWLFYVAISLVFQIITSAGLTSVSLHIVRGFDFGLTDFKLSFQRFWKYLVTLLILTLVASVGFVFLIIPGVYFLLTYGFALYFVVDKNTSPNEAFRLSKKLAEGNRIKLLQLGLAMIGLNILGAIALGVGLFVSIPVSLIACAWVYNELLKKGTASEIHTEPVPAPLEAAEIPTTPAPEVATT